MTPTHSQTDMDNVIIETVPDSHAKIRQCYGDMVKTMPQSWDTNDPETGHKSQQHDSECICKIMNGLRKGMAVFGMYHMNKESNMSPERTHSMILRRLFQTKQNLYHIVVLLVMWLSVVRTILSFVVGENSSNFRITRIMAGTWLLQVAINTTLMIKASHPRFGSQSKVWKLWKSDVMPLMKCLDVEMNSKFVCRQILLCLVIGWMCSLSNCVLMTFFILFEGTTFYDLLPHLMITPLPVNIYTRSYLIVLNVYGSVAWILPLVYVICMCTVLRSAFHMNSRSLQDSLNSRHDRNEYLQCFHRQRLLHLNISKMVTLLDKDFRWFFGNWFCTGIPLACFILYNILKGHDMDWFTLCSYAFWLASNILAIAFTASFAASTNDAAHSALDHIYDVGMSGISLEQLGQVNLFLFKLNGSPIGFTIVNLITITKELLLTIGGLYLTYFFVLWQF